MRVIRYKQRDKLCLLMILEKGAVELYTAYGFAAGNARYEPGEFNFLPLYKCFEDDAEFDDLFEAHYADRLPVMEEEGDVDCSGIARFSFADEEFYVIGLMTGEIKVVRLTDEFLETVVTSDELAAMLSQILNIYWPMSKDKDPEVLLKEYEMFVNLFETAGQALK